MDEARDFWDHEICEQKHVSWMEHPTIREYINASIGGGHPMWPFDWFQGWLSGRRFARALSIGCGGGALERDLVARGLCESIDAFDGSLASLHVARTTADKAGLGSRIRYFAADFNEPALPRGKYDVVFFHQSAHHVAKLEKLFRATLLALKPDGLLYLDEYVGPSRFDWSDGLLAPHRAVYASIPQELRILDTLPYPIQADDPSEAFRSSEIQTQMLVGFDVVARRPYGGTLLSVLYPALRSGLSNAFMSRLIAEERRLLDAGIPSYYVVIVACPKRGLRKLVATANYSVAALLLPGRRFLRRLASYLRKAVTAISRVDSWRTGTHCC